jgi:hypothetical protein
LNYVLIIGGLLLFLVAAAAIWYNFSSPKFMVGFGKRIVKEIVWQIIKASGSEKSKKTHKRFKELSERAQDEK